METDVPADIKPFIDEVVDSFAMWDMLLLYAKMADVVADPVETAKLLGRREEELIKPMEKLEKLGMTLCDKKTEGEWVCRLNQRSKYYGDYQKFVAYNGTQEDRLRILSYLLQKRTR